MKKYGGCDPHFKLKVLRRMWRDELRSSRLPRCFAGIHQCVNYYNNDRIPLKLKGLEPAEFRNQASNT